MLLLGDDRVRRDCGLKRKSLVIPKAVLWPVESAFACTLNERGIKGYEAKMMKKSYAEPAPSDQTWVLSSLEPDQLVKAKKHPIPRRHLKGPELLILWSLRVYLLFMMVVVTYQVWLAAR